MKKLLIRSNITIRKALDTLNSTGRKCLIVVDNKSKLIGTLSDGDVRKAISKRYSLNTKIFNIMNTNPKYINERNYQNQNIKDYFIKYLIDLIPVIDEKKIIKKIIFWEDLFKNEEKKIMFNSNKNIPVIIMAGGKGTRLEPFTKILPKPLIPVNGKTIVERIIENFSRYGFKSFN